MKMMFFKEPFKYNHQDQYLTPHTIHQLIILMTGILLLIIKNSKILLSVIAFHIYVILGIDADTFKLNSGTSFFEQAQKILDFSQQKGFRGWGPGDGLQSRYYLIDNILSTTFKEFRNVMYDYHIKGLDIMVNETKAGKEAVAKSLMMLDQMNRRRPNSYILRVFFDTKANEILDVFSGGPKVPVTNLISTLSKIAPNHSDKWRNISF